MPENQKRKKDGTVGEDQKEHEYYYDDAHGYEDYVPEEEEEDDSEDRPDSKAVASPPSGPANPAS